ncbi:hypothetical protein ACFLZ7_02440 [Nanoarchaeota archaeon]
MDKVNFYTWFEDKGELFARCYDKICGDKPVEEKTQEDLMNALGLWKRATNKDAEVIHENDIVRSIVEKGQETQYRKDKKEYNLELIFSTEGASVN